VPRITIVQPQPARRDNQRLSEGGRDLRAALPSIRQLSSVQGVPRRDHTGGATQSARALPVGGRILAEEDALRRYPVNVSVPVACSPWGAGSYGAGSDLYFAPARHQVVAPSIVAEPGVRSLPCAEPPASRYAPRQMGRCKVQICPPVVRAMRLHWDLRNTRAGAKYRSDPQCRARLPAEAPYGGGTIGVTLPIVPSGDQKVQPMFMRQPSSDGVSELSKSTQSRL